MQSIVGIGACVYDILMEFQTFPAEDTKAYAESVKESGGGPCATGLVAAAKLGGACVYLGNLAEDSGGRFLLEDFQRYGVSTELVTMIPSVSSFSCLVVLSQETTSRTCLLNRGNIPPLRLEARQKDLIRNASVLMVDGNQLNAAVEAASLTRKAGGDVLYDAGGLYEGIDRLLPLANILIPSEEFAKGYTGEPDAVGAARRLMELYHPDVVVVTQGKRGGLCLDAKGLSRYPIFPAKVVDSNGAGDVFHGAFAFGLTLGWSYMDCCIFSSAASALKCRHVGSREGSPNYNSVVDFLMRQGICWDKRKGALR